MTVLQSAASPGAVGDAIETVEADVVVVALEPGESPSLPFRVQSDRAARPQAIVVLGDEPTTSWATRAIRSGARGVLPRTATTDQILAAVLAAAAGLVVREPTAIDSPSAAGTGSFTAHPPQALTPREVEILGLLAEGLGNKTIASRLGISEHTVKTHVTSIFAKLEVSTRTEAVAIAARLGLIML
jgi:DNA-binding NarL/FixJ family response regulator